MGKIKKVFVDKLINPVADRSSNRIFIYKRGEDSCIGIHFRNISFKLTEEQFEEWQDIFKKAKEIIEPKEILLDV